MKMPFSPEAYKSKVKDNNEFSYSGYGRMQSMPAPSKIVDQNEVEPAPNVVQVGKRKPRQVQ